MSWSEVTAPVPPKTKQTLKISSDTVGLILWINAKLAVHLGLAAGSPYRLLAGHGEAAGRIKLAESEAGGFAAKVGVRGLFRMRLAAFPGVPLERRKGTLCHSKSTGEEKGRELIIVLPDWARGSTAAAPKPPPGDARDRAAAVRDRRDVRRLTLNQQMVLRGIERMGGGDITKKDLARSCGVMSHAVAGAVQALIDLGCIRGVRTVATKLPKPPRGRTIAWSTPDHCFTPQNPRQMGLFGVRDVTPQVLDDIRQD